MPLISRIRFGTYLSYSPYGEGENAKLSRGIRDALKYDKKGGNPPIQFSEHIVAQLVSDMSTLPFNDFFNKDTMLIPVPGSGKTDFESLWPARRLVKSMETQGLGVESSTLIRNTHIRKSAYCKSDNRPVPQEHFDTFSINSSLKQPKTIVLVDDIATRGSTLLAASKVRQAYPQTDILGFAFLRAITNTDESEDIETPVVGHIILRENGQTQRIP